MDCIGLQSARNVSIGKKHCFRTENTGSRFCRRFFTLPEGALLAAELAMLPSKPASRKGPARHASTEVKVKTLRQQRWRDKSRLAKLIAAETEIPAELRNLQPGVNGRPRLSDIEIMAPDHAAAHRKRASLASLAHARTLVAQADAVSGMIQLAEAANVECEKAERRAAKIRARLAKLEKSLSECNSEGITGLLLKQMAHTVPKGTRGNCVVCYDDTYTLTPCCTNQPDRLIWLCADCVNQAALVYARLPTTDGFRRDDGGPRPINSAHLGSRCPWCKLDGAFTNGARALLCVEESEEG